MEPTPGQQRGSGEVRAAGQRSQREQALQASALRGSEMDSRRRSSSDFRRTRVPEDKHSRKYRPGLITRPAMTLRYNLPRATMPMRPSQQQEITYLWGLS